METIKKNQSEIKTTQTEIKNILHGVNSREDEAEKQISKLEGKKSRRHQLEQQKEENFRILG